MHLQIATACQEDSFSYLALMQTFIIQTGFSEACAVLFLMNKKKQTGWVGNAVMQAFQMRLGQHHIWITARRICQAELRHASAPLLKLSPRIEGEMQKCPQPVCALAPLSAVLLPGRALAWHCTVLQRSLIAPLLCYAQTYGSTPTGKCHKRNFAAITETLFCVKQNQYLLSEFLPRVWKPSVARFH